MVEGVPSDRPKGAHVTVQHPMERADAVSSDSSRKDLVPQHRFRLALTTGT